MSRVGEFDGIPGLLQGAVRQAQEAGQPENGDYYDEEGFLVCGNCHTRRQVEVNMPDLKAVRPEEESSGQDAGFLPLPS